MGDPMNDNNGKKMIEEIGNIPNLLKVIMTFINRVGFPIVAFILMFLMCAYSMKTNTKAMEENTKALTALSINDTTFQDGAIKAYSEIQECINAVMTDCQIKKRR
jgi:hydroxyethylthiazole kinase-like sugar kinase family protein